MLRGGKELWRKQVVCQQERKLCRDEEDRVKQFRPEFNSNICKVALEASTRNFLKGVSFEIVEKSSRNTYIHDDFAI